MPAKLLFHCTVAAAALIVQAGDDTPPQDCPAQRYCTLGLIYGQLGLWRRAIAAYKQALIAFRAADDLMGIGETCRQLGTLMVQRHQYPLARRWAELAIHSFTKAERRETAGRSPYRSHYAAALHLLGTVSYHQGHYPLAVKQLEKALGLRYELQDELGEALVLADLGRAYQAQGQCWYALACYEGALDICQPREAAFEGGWFEAEVRHRMAKLYRSCGHWEMALKHQLEALALGRGGRDRRPLALEDDR